MAKIEIYTWQYCPFCIRAKALLDSKNVIYQEYQIDGDSEAKERMTNRASGRSTVPQIFINDVSIGGCEELYNLEKSDQLNSLINKE